MPTCASMQLTTSAPHRILSARCVHYATAVGDVIATCVAHQYSIVKELDFVFRSQDSAPGFGSDSWILICVCAVFWWAWVELNATLPTSPSFLNSLWPFGQRAGCSSGPLKILVGLGRIELPTSPLSGVRSSQLSYRPGHSKANWWSWSGSNRRPPECKSGALPAELQPLFWEVGSRR